MTGYQITQEDIEKARDVREHLLRDPHRPGYHFVVPEGQAHPADPNGAIFWQGNVHLGYIYQRHGKHCWGHVSSHDWLHWKHHLPWLTPTADSPEEGIFSGNCFHGKDEAVFLYHGMKKGNSIATASDYWLENVLKSPANPIVPVQDDEGRRTGSQGWASWDPHGFIAKDGTYYGIFGGHTPSVFKTRDLHSRWDYVGDFLAHPLEGVDLHEDVSCPDFFQLGDKWVMLCISHELGCRYYVGDWRNEQFHPEYHEQMSWVDNGFFAPESLLDDQGRRIMWAWSRDERDRDTVQTASGWSGTFSFPCEMVLEGGRIGLKPIEELQSVCYPGVNQQSMLHDGDDLVVQGLESRSIDICAWFMPKGAQRYGVKVCRSPQGEEETVIGVDVQERVLFVDTTKSSLSLGKKLVERAPIPQSVDLQNLDGFLLRVLVDNSIVEAFALGTQAVRRIYPTRSDSNLVSYWAEGGDCELDVATTHVKRTNSY